MKTRKQVAEALAIHYSKKFNGIVWSAFDSRKRCYFIRGESLPAREDLKHLYPNGWSLLDYIKPKKARALVGGATP